MSVVVVVGHKDSRRQGGRQRAAKTATAAEGKQAGRSESKAKRVENEDKINVDNETDYKFDINKKNEKGKEYCVN